MENQEREFAPGFFAKPKHQNAPEWVKEKISIKIDDALTFLMAERDAGNEFVNLQLKESLKGNVFLEVDRWKPDAGHNGNHGQQEPPKASKPKKGETIYDDGEDDGLPF